MNRIRAIENGSNEKYIRILGAELSDNLGRDCYEALEECDEDEDIKSVLAWRLKNLSSEDKIEAQLELFVAGEGADAGAMLGEYHKRATGEGVGKTVFEMSMLPGDIQKILADNGFELTKKESVDLLEPLSSVALLKLAKKKTSPSYIKPVSELDLLQFKRGITNCMFSGRYGLEEDLPDLPMEWFEMDVSCCVITDDKVSSLFLVRMTKGGILMPVLLFSQGIDADKYMLEMMRFAINAAASKYPGDTQVLLRRHDSKTRKLTDYLFPGAKGKTVICGIRSEK
ncbi:MAG: hypothetical protein E7307_08030 [Butyrivibrio sp.]|nr:hypothetical protein [Butyrivibrio sp.]